jgi:hypothetical protein
LLVSPFLNGCKFNQTSGEPDGLPIKFMAAAIAAHLFRRKKKAKLPVAEGFFSAPTFCPIHAAVEPGDAGEIDGNVLQ